MSYQTPNGSARATLEIKKSEFISYGFAVSDREQAMFHVKQLREKYPDARHHCWAYVIGNPNNTTSAGFDDDGEPSGTAGKPILNVLQHKAIGNILIVVVRYFGGIKLGAGGLTRAYGSSAQAVIDEMVFVPYIPTMQIEIETDYAGETQVRYLLAEISGSVDDVTYGNDVMVTATIAVAELAQLKEKLTMVGTILSEDDNND